MAAQGAGEPRREGRWLARTWLTWLTQAGVARRAPAAGQAMVEAAITLPLLLLVALGLVQFALVAHAQSVVTGAAQDGARLAAAIDRTPAEGESHARAVLRAGLGTSARIAVIGEEDGQVVVLTARAELSPIIPWTPNATIPIAARAQMSKERFRTRE